MSPFLFVFFYIRVTIRSIIFLEGSIMRRII